MRVYFVCTEVWVPILKHSIRSELLIEIRKFHTRYFILGAVTTFPLCTFAIPKSSQSKSCGIHKMMYLSCYLTFLITNNSLNACIGFVLPRSYANNDHVLKFSLGWFVKVNQKASVPQLLWCCLWWLIFQLYFR